MTLKEERQVPQCSDEQRIGNTAKEYVRQRTRTLLTTTPGLEILDVGCVGPAPFDTWRSLFAEFPDGFSYTGVDVAGIERAQRIAAERGWSRVRLLTASGYDLPRVLPGAHFDVVVSVQVLEHVRHVDRFMQAVISMVKPGGRVIIALDSGHFQRHHGSLRDRLRALAALLGRERSHDRPLRSETMERVFAAHGLRVTDRKCFNLHPLKWIHNHGMTTRPRDEFVEHWYALELALNDDPRFIEAHRRLFLTLYYEGVVAPRGAGQCATS